MGLFGDIFGGIFGNASSISSQQRQNRYNLSQWNRENEYNKPINQMSRLREAGVNPNLAFASGSGGNISAHSFGSVGRDTSGTSAIGQGVGNIADNFLNFKMNYQMLKNSRQSQVNSNKETDANVALKLAEVDKVRAETENVKKSHKFIGSQPQPWMVNKIHSLGSSLTSAISKNFSNRPDAVAKRAKIRKIVDNDLKKILGNDYYKLKVR